MASFFDNKARKAEAAASSSKKPETVVAPRMQPWVEKYRPKTLEDVKSQDHATQVLRKMINASNLPHLLLYGPPGTGKTSTILALCRELFGPELYSSRVLELNASDERGISVIRERVKGFAQQALVNAPLSKEYRQKYPCPPIKWIVLDEADQLTQESQAALRRTMEVYSKITRFCLCCNYVSRIIDPVASRCSKFRFKSLEGDQGRNRLKEILDAEGVSYADGVIEKTLKVADGDLRKAIQLLQSAARLVGFSSDAAPTNGHSGKQGRKKKIVDDDDEDEDMVDADDDSIPPSKTTITIPIIDEISGVVPSPIIDTLLLTLRKGNTTNYKAISKLVTDIVANGYSANEVLSSLFSRVMFDEMLAATKKNRLSLVFSEMDARLVDGVDEHLLMLDMALQIAGIFTAP